MSNRLQKLFKKRLENGWELTHRVYAPKKIEQEVLRLVAMLVENQKRLDKNKIRESETHVLEESLFQKLLNRESLYQNRDKLKNNT